MGLALAVDPKIITTSRVDVSGFSQQNRKRVTAMDLFKSDVALSFDFDWDLGHLKDIADIFSGSVRCLFDLITY